MKNETMRQRVRRIVLDTIGVDIEKTRCPVCDDWHDQPCRWLGVYEKLSGLMWGST